MKLYEIEVKHDKGTVKILVQAQNIESAKNQGMEIYKARSALQFKAEREANAAAVVGLSVGQVFGSLSVNHKRVNKCTIKAIDGSLITFTGVIGKYQCEFKVESRHIQGMIARAVQNKWRKS